MKICAGILEYADPEGLDRCLKSLNIGNGGLDGAIVIHNRFPNFPPQWPASQLTLFEEAKAVTDKYFGLDLELCGGVFLTATPEPLPEVQARSLYFEAAEQVPYDWLLVIDTDEYVAPNADWKEFRRQVEFVQSLGLSHQIFDVEFEGTSAERGPRPRLFYLRPGKISYFKKHFWFLLHRTSTLYKGMGDAGRVITGIYILHDPTLRDAAYFKASWEYKRWQMEYEGNEGMKEINNNNSNT